MDFSEKVWQFLTKISQPRFVGSVNHGEVRKDIIGHMTSIPNYEVVQQSFPAGVKAFSPAKIILLIIGVLVCSTPFAYAQDHVVLGLVLTMLAFCFALLLVPLGGFFHRRSMNNPEVIREGTNLIFQAKNTQVTVGEELPSKTMVLLAHYDSITRPFSVVLNAAFYIVAGFGTLLFLLQSTIYALLKLLGHNIALSWTLYLWSFAIGFVLLMFIYDHSSNHTPGTLDNGSGVAALYQLALTFDQVPLQNTQLILVATDAEELGNLGGKAFIDQFSGDYPEDSTYYLVVDTIGCPKINRIVTGSKSPSHQFSPYLTELARQELHHQNQQRSNSEAHPLKLYQFPPLVGIQSDHTPLLNNQKPFLLIGGVSPVLHSSKDNLDAIDRTKFFDITQFIEAFLRRFDSQ